MIIDLLFKEAAGMLFRFFEKQVEIECNDCICCEEKGIELEYYLTESWNPENDECVLYGIEVVKKHFGEISERVQFQDVFNSREKTTDLIELLARNTVTPMSLASILDDILAF